MLAPSLGRHACDGALEDLEQGLLDALARHVARDRDVTGRAADLVDFVDVDDSLLGAVDVEVGALQELEQNVLDVLADIAGLGQSRRIGHRERDVEHLGERARQEGLARTGRTDQEDVRLLDLDVVVEVTCGGGRQACGLGVGTAGGLAGRTVRSDGWTLLA